MKFYRNENIDPSFNLALDEVLMNSDKLGDEPCFGFWRNSRSVIVGCNQVVENEVNIEYCHENQIPIIKRCTGGGAVYHDLDNLNFSFLFPKDSVEVCYAKCTKLMCESLHQLGLNVCKSPTNDLFLDGCKFSGMAMKLGRRKVLVHGTLMYDVDIDVMNQALSNPKGKFMMKRGVGSRHAMVTNLRHYLQLKDIRSLQAKMEDFLSDGDPIYEIDGSDIKEAYELSLSKYKSYR